jgi:hypothetical protein
MTQLYGDYRKKLQEFATSSKPLSARSSRWFSAFSASVAGSDESTPSLSPGQDDKGEAWSARAELSIFCVVKSLSFKK